MYIHFKGQGRDVSINMNQVKEVQYNVKNNNPDLSDAIRLVMQYPQNIAGSLTGMFHFDFFFNDEEQRNDCRLAFIRILEDFSNAPKFILLPEIKGK